MTRRAGHRLFAQYAYPPHELGYCGPDDNQALSRPGEDMTAVAKEFDGAWPYLEAIAHAADIDDPLDFDVVRSYWVGGPALDSVNGPELLNRLRSAFSGQVTGLLDELSHDAPALANHSFHVFVVYPWIRFLDADPTTPMRILQSCRIRWGTVLFVDNDYVDITSRPLAVEAGRLTLGSAVAERVRWRKDGRSLVSEPTAGDVVAAHWDWVCATLHESDCAALTQATCQTLRLVNALRDRR